MDDKKTKKIIVLIVVALIVLTVAITLMVVFLGSDGESSDSFNYSVVSGKAVISKYNGSEKEIVIPSKLKGKKVSGFVEDAFKDSKVEKIEFAKNYSGKEISKKAFKGAGSLKNVVLPQSIEIIGEEAFAGCTYLKYVNFGEKVTDIKINAFFDCTALQYNFEMQEGEVEADTDFDLPVAIKNVGNSAFYKCANLDTVVVPDSLTTIEESAFEGCKNLVNLKVSAKNSIKTIGKSAFEGTNILSKKNEKTGEDKEVFFPMLETIGEKAFYGMRGSQNFEYVKLSKTVKTIGDYAFANNLATLEVAFESGIDISSFGVGVFSDLAYLTRVGMIGQEDSAPSQLPDNLKTVPELTFSGCIRLLNTKDFAIGKNVETIGDGAFSIYNCSDTKASNRASYTKHMLLINAENTKFVFEKLPVYYKTPVGTEKESELNHYLLMTAEGKLLSYIGGFTSEGHYSYKNAKKTNDFHFLDSQGIREKVNAIGGYAFGGVQFTRLDINKKVEQIGKNIIGGSKITSVVMNNNDCEKVDADAFASTLYKNADGSRLSILMNGGNGTKEGKFYDTFKGENGSFNHDKYGYIDIGVYTS